MPEIRFPLRIVLFILLFIHLFPSVSLSRSFEMSALEVDINLTSAGLMKIEERRVFTFQGEFSEVFRTFPLNGKATFSNFNVLENGVPYQRSESMQPGTFFIEEKDDIAELRIFADSRDTTRVFQIQFDVEGAVERYEDAVLLYYQIISDEWDQSIYDIHAQIIPPASLPPGEPAHWVHGSLEAVSEIKEGGEVEILLEELPSYRYLEIRALYPPEYFHEMPVLDGMIRQKVQNEAEELVAEANQLRQERLQREERQKERSETGRKIILPLSLVFFLVWVYFYKKFAKRPVIENKNTVFKELPEKELPALVSYLVFQTQVTGNALISTLFYLAYRKFIVIKEEELPARSSRKPKTDIVFYFQPAYFKDHQDELVDYEKNLLHFLFNEISPAANRISLKEIRKKRMSMQSFFPKWKKKVVEEAKIRKWYDQESKANRNKMLMGSSLLFTAGLISTFFFGPWMLILLGLSIVLLIGSLFVFHRTEKGEIAYRRWWHLRKILKKSKFADTSEKLDSERVNEYLIYGIALMLGRRFYKRLFSHVERSGNQSFMWWIVLHQSSMHDFSKTIDRVITTASSTLSSASGAGGGGTMGGGGGASSGGGGAR